MALADRPGPAADGGLPDVHAAGVSLPGLLLSQGRYQMRPEVPFVMGLEAAGVVARAPAGSGLEPGQRVVATAFGAWAERVVAQPDQVFPLPDRLTMAQGAGL